MLRIVFGAICLSVAILAVPPLAYSAEALQDLYEAKTYTNAEGSALPCRLLKPEETEPGKTYPLVLFLHGAGERGTDNVKQLLHSASEFTKPENRRKYPCFVLAPQCPPKKRWVEVDWKLPSHTMPEKPSVPLSLALELLDKLVAELPVDTSRIYITGLSMGGFGTWDAIQRRPDFFAAAIPVCGGGDTAQAPKLRNLPIWAFHGDKDTVVMPQRTPAMIDAIRKAGGQPKMTIYSGVGHNTWAPTYSNPEVLAWLFARKK